MTQTKPAALTFSGFLKTMRERLIGLRRVGDRLQCSPASRLTPELTQAMRDHKPLLMAYLHYRPDRKLTPSDFRQRWLPGLFHGMVIIDPEERGVTARELLKIACESDPVREEFQDSLCGLCQVRSADGLPTTRELGSHIGHLKGYECDGLTLSARRTSLGNLWVVEEFPWVNGVKVACVLEKEGAEE